MARPRILELDAMRGLAALAVVLFHLTTRFDRLYGHATPPSISLPWGHYGVQFFFGLSGFVIFMTLERTRRPTDFIVSRLSRLYPAYWAAIAITALVVATGPLPDLQRSPAVILANLTMLQGFAGMPHVDGVYWTLAVELAFYGCMFGLYLGRALRWIDGVLILWIGLKWVWWLYPDLSFLLGSLLVQAYVPYFAIGICTYRLHAGTGAWPMTLTVIAWALLTVAAVDGMSEAGVALMVAATFLGFARGWLRWLGWAPVQWLGGVSYPLYLLHENIGFVLLARARAAGWPTDGAIAAVLAVVILLAWLVSRLVERPALHAIRHGWTRWQKRRAASAGPC